MSSNSPPFDNLALSIVQRLGSGSTGRVILVSSARPGEGKSYVAKRIAKRLALQADAPVSLIDANAEHPSLKDVCKYASGGGLFECIESRELQVERLVSSDTPGLFLMPATGPLQLSLLFRSGSIQRVLDGLRHRFAYTVIDGPSVSSAGCLPQESDATVIVVDASRTRRDIVSGALDSPHVDRNRVMGVVLNRRPEYVPAWFYRSWL